MSNECENCQNGQCKNNKDVQNPERRKFMGIAATTINLILAGAFVGPVIGFITSPLSRKKQGRWIPILWEREIGVGEIKDVTYEIEVEDGYHTVKRKYTVFLSRTESGVTCFDPACTHLGCRVKFKENSHKFFCPCHGGVFTAEGNVVSGPPPKPLEQHQVKVEKGQIWVYRES